MSIIEVVIDRKIFHFRNLVIDFFLNYNKINSNLLLLINIELQFE